jgi:uncharacterized membrane protein
MSWVLCLVSFSSLVWYSHRIATSIQNPDMIARIVDDFDSAFYSTSSLPRGASKEGGQLPSGEAAVLLTGHSGYYQSTEHTKLIQAVAALDGAVEILFRPGQFVLHGEPLARVWPASALPALEGTLKKCLKVGRHRVLRQDTEFGILQIVEIAIRALSPAVNDTFTGVACVDWLADGLVVVLNCPVSDGDWFDGAGKLRLRQPEVQFARLARAAFDQIRQASADTPAVLIRILIVITRLAPRLRDTKERDSLREQAQAVWETANRGQLVALDLADVEAAFREAQRALEV